MAASSPPSSRFAPVVPPAPRPWTGNPPLWRRLLQLRRDALPTWGPGAYEAWAFKGTFLGRASFLLNEPDAIRRVLVENHANYGRTPATLRILHPMIGDGLFLAEGAAWRFQRRTTAPAFAPRSLDLVAAVAARRTAELGLGLRAAAGDRHDLLAVVQRLALAIAGETLFSQAMEPWAPALRGAMERYGMRFARPSPLDFVLGPDTPSPALLMRRRAGRAFHEVIERIIAERRGQGVAEPPRDLFDALVGARDPETGRGFTAQELRDQVATLIIAGHETTALALFWSLYLLTLAPDVQDAVAAEARSVDLSPEGAAAAVPRLRLARAVVQEALRLYPPAYSIVRVAEAADRLAGHEVPPGALVVIAPWVLHRHKRLWAEPERFDPGRFLPGAPPPDRFAYLPFGIGPRVCIGAQFALVEATIVLAALLRDWALDIPSGKRVKPVAVVTVHPERAPLFRLRPRPA
jgi:unspecific monooxygenase